MPSRIHGRIAVELEDEFFRQFSEAIMDAVAEKIANRVSRTLLPSVPPAAEKSTDDAKGALLSVRQLATYLGISRQTVYKMVGTGEITAHIVHGVTKFKPADVERYLTSARRRNRARAQAG